MRNYSKVIAFAVIIDAVIVIMLIMGVLHMTNQFYEVAKIADENITANMLLVEQNKQLVEENARLTKSWLDAELQCLKNVVQVCCDEGGTASEGD